MSARLDSSSSREYCLEAKGLGFKLFGKCQELAFVCHDLWKMCPSDIFNILEPRLWDIVVMVIKLDLSQESYIMTILKRDVSVTNKCKEQQIEIKNNISLHQMNHTPQSMHVPFDLWSTCIFIFFVQSFSYILLRLLFTLLPKLLRIYNVLR